MAHAPTSRHGTIEHTNRTGPFPVDPSSTVVRNGMSVNKIYLDNATFQRIFNSNNKQCRIWLLKIHKDQKTLNP